MSSPRYPISLRSGYNKIVDSESWDNLKPPHTSRSLARFCILSYRTAFFAVSGLYILTLTLGISVIFYPRLSQRPSLSPIPKIPHDQTVIFNAVKDFEAQGSGMTKDDPWVQLMPEGRGFIEIPVEVPLPDGGTEVKDEYYCISMFHQLHCIAGLKAAFENMSNDNETMQKQHSTHLGHCLDYLRQAVMCVGDMTLEPAFDLTGPDAGTKGVNGWNVAHQCRNYQTMYDFAEEHRYLNSSGIL